MKAILICCVAFGCSRDRKVTIVCNNDLREIKKCLDDGAISGHSYAAKIYGHETRGLLELLEARWLERATGETSTPLLDAAIKSTIALVCGDDGRVKDLFDEKLAGAAIDDLYPPDAVVDAQVVGCGVVYRRNGTKVSWQLR